MIRRLGISVAIVAFIGGIAGVGCGEPEETPDAGPSHSPDCGHDHDPDAGNNQPPDSGQDSGTDAGTDAGQPQSITLYFDVDTGQNRNLADGGITAWGMARNAIDMAIEEATGADGKIEINGERIKDVTIEVREHKCSPTDSTLAQKFMVEKVATESKVIAFMGSFCGGAGNSTAYEIPTTSALGMIHMSVAAYTGFTKPVTGMPTEPAIYYPTGTRNFARLNVLDSYQGNAGAGWMKKLGATSVYIVTDGQTPEQGIGDAAKDALAGLSLTEAGYQQITPGISTGDAATLATDIAGTNADFIFVSTKPAEASTIIAAIRANSTLANVKVLVPNNVRTAANFLSGLGSAATDIYALGVGLPTAQYTGAMKTWWDAYVAKYPTGATYSFIPHYYEATKLLLKTIEDAGDKADDRNEIRTRIMGTQNYSGVLGTWSFDADGDISTGLFSGYQASGTSFNFVEQI